MRRSVPVIAASVSVLGLGVLLWLRYEFIATNAQNLGELFQEIWLAALLRPIVPFTHRPWLALLLAGAFAGVWLRVCLALRGRHRWVQVVLGSATSVWLAYAALVYEVHRSMANTPPRLIMVDGSGRWVVMLIDLVLESVSLLALVAIWRDSRAAARSPIPPPAA